MNFSFVEPWDLFLPRDGGHVVALCGSGGKTSLLKVFARQFESEKIKSILTCTTRTESLSGFPVFELPDLEKMDDDTLPDQFYLHNGQMDGNKWKGVSPDDLEQLGQRFSDRVILVEVDGSACKPLKYYRPGEPVWPRQTSLAVVAMSSAAVGQSAGSVVHRFGKQVFEPLKELKSDSIWLWDHSFTLLTGSGGYVDQIPAEIPVVLALTCLGDQNDSIGLFEFAGRAMAHERLPLIVFCETEGEAPFYRTSCRRDDEDDASDGPGE